MKKKILSLALVLILILALVPSAFAASMPDEVTKVSGAEDTTFTRSVVTPHDYLGEVSIGGLWLNGNEINTWKFGVFIVDDNAEIFETQGYLSKKLSNYILMNDDSAEGCLYLENGKVNIDLGWSEYEGDCTKADPHIYRYGFQADAWMPQIGALYMYDTDYEYAGWFDWSVIIFTKSQLAAFKSNGTLPPMTNMWGMIGENNVDFSSYVDLTALKALLSSATIALPASDKPSSWAEPGVNAAIAANLVPQSLQSKYTQTITRAEYCALTVQFYETLTGQPITERKTFSDTTDINVQKLGGLGIVSGGGDGTFNPNGEFSRTEVAVMTVQLLNKLGKPLPASASTFADNNDIPAWARGAVGQVQSAGLMGGVGDNKFGPNGKYTRESGIVLSGILWGKYQ